MVLFIKPVSARINSIPKNRKIHNKPLFIILYAILIYYILNTRYYILILFIGFDKLFDRTIISPLRLGREQTSRKLTHIPMVSNTITTFAFSTTGFIGTGAITLVFFDIAFHCFSSLFFYLNYA